MLQFMRHHPPQPAVTWHPFHSKCFSLFKKDFNSYNVEHNNGSNFVDIIDSEDCLSRHDCLHHNASALCQDSSGLTQKRFGLPFVERTSSVPAIMTI